jgi:DNA-binding MarR family transcriptional regulator
MVAAVPKAVGDLSPSAKLVAVVLATEGGLTPAELGDRTQLPPSTLRDAVRQLRSEGYLETVPSRDARQHCHRLVVESSDETRRY